MKRIARTLTLLLSSMVLPSTVSAQAFDHAPWDRILKKHVTEDGLVDYAALKAGPAELDACVAQIAARSPHSHPGDFSTREAQLAYWINAYNALTVKGVVDHWPTKSVRDLGMLFGFFRRDDYTAGGKKVSLNDIEHGILRKQFAEPRIHFALVCASLGCPRLRREAYTPERLEQQLEDGARFFVNEARNLKIDPARNRVTVNKIFDWYGEDFENYVKAKNLTGAGRPILDYVRIYASEANRVALAALKKPALDYSDYSWAVNATGAKSEN